MVWIEASCELTTFLRRFIGKPDGFVAASATAMPIVSDMRKCGKLRELPAFPGEDDLAGHEHRQESADATAAIGGFPPMA
ncbi:hypothetical protein ACNJX9_29680 [Bradyrhizobium sp. DASA03076]|uniref:hypothetical protein n=1 Tax=Bradyrhizobium sp. BLXBL-03 TaxID=3395916 RepID=UPI003F6E8035